MKPGYLTSEFLLSVLVIVASTVALLHGDIDADKWAFVIGGVSIGYSASRGAAKILPPKDTLTDTPVD